MQVACSFLHVATCPTLTQQTERQRSQTAMDQGAGQGDCCEPQSGAQSGLSGPGRAKTLDALGEAGLALELVGPEWPEFNYGRQPERKQQQTSTTTNKHDDDDESNAAAAGVAR